MIEEKVIPIALLGFGTVGYGTYQVLKRQEPEMVKKTGARLEIRKILVRDVKKAAAKVEDPSLITDSWEEILEDPKIQIVAELMGGLEPAGTYIRQALLAGKHVVTANKDLLAQNHGKLLDLAGEKGCDLLFEAAVAGAIPVITPLKQSLAANRLDEIMGIVNGTTNFILTRMNQEGMEFSEALSLAADLGYAEADPTADIEGLDAGRKVAILASIAYHSRVALEDVHIEGITKITAKDMQYAREMGCVIKLIGMSRCDGGQIEAYVAPMLIPSSHPLASVNDAYNAVFVHGDAVGDAMFFGKGAGQLPTASAVAGDLFEIARNILHGCCGRISCTCYKHLPVRQMKEVKSRYFLRFLVEDRAGVLAELAAVFARYQVSVEQVMQKKKQGHWAELVIITEEVREGDMEQALLAIQEKDCTREISSVIRAYGEPEN